MEVSQLVTAVVQARDDGGLKWGGRVATSQCTPLQSSITTSVFWQRWHVARKKDLKALGKERKQNWEIIQGFPCCCSM